MVVILPFDVIGDNTLNKDIGTSLSESVSVYLEYTNNVFNGASGDSNFKQNENPSLFDPVEDLMTILPLSNIPKTESVNTKIIQPIKIFGFIDIPVDMLIIKALPYFCKAIIDATIIKWNDDIIIKISTGSHGSFTVHTSNKLGFDQLVKRVGAALIDHERWLAIPEMRTAAKELFSDGLGDYLDYLKTRDPDALKSAESKYNNAVIQDPLSALARLHLAVVQYERALESEKYARNSIDNFSLILGDDSLKAAAEIGWMAATLRYVERYHPNCYLFNQYMEPLIRQVQSSNIEQGKERLLKEIDRIILYGRVLFVAGEKLAEEPDCRLTSKNDKESSDVHEIIARSRELFNESTKLIGERQGNAPFHKQIHIDLYLKLLEAYTWDSDAVGYSLLGDSFQTQNALTHGLELFSALLKEKQALPYWQRRGFAPFLRGSIADDELRLAEFKSPNEAAYLRDDAVNQLLSALVGGTKEVTAWAALRLADVGFAEQNWNDGIRWLVIGSREFDGNEYPLQDLLDQNNLTAGIFFPLQSKVCSAIKKLEYLAQEDSFGVMVPVFLADILRRNGDLNGADNFFKIAQSRFSLLGAMRGTDVAWELAAVKTKIELARRLIGPSVEAAHIAAGPPRYTGPVEIKPRQFLLDEYEILTLAKLASLQVESGSPVVPEQVTSLIASWQVKPSRCGD